MVLLIVKVLGIISNLLSLCIVIDSLASWIPNINRHSGFMGYISDISDKLCDPIREVISKFIGYPPIDFSPVIAIILINFVYRTIITLLLRFQFLL